MREDTDPKYDISERGRKLVKEWQQSVARTQRLKKEYDASITEQATARDALIKWCSPADAKPGEKFGIWSRDQYGNEVLIEAVVESMEGSAAENGGVRKITESTINLRYRK